MKNRSILIICFLVIALICAGCARQITGNESGKIRVAVTIFPFFDAAKAIGRDMVEVSLLLPAGASPHDYSFTPNDLKTAHGSRIILYNGFGLDDWAVKFSSEINAKAVNVSEKLSAEYSKHGNNPHFWLSPELFLVQCQAIRDALINEDPDNRDYYIEGFNEYSQRVLETASSLRKKARSAQNTRLITYHDAFVYFAEYFGFEICATIVESSSEVPKPSTIRDVVEKIARFKIGTVYKEPQQSEDIYRAIVEDTGVKVMTLDPLGDGENIKTYEDLIRFNVETILNG